MASTAAFSTSLFLPRSRTRPVLSPSPSQCQLRRPTGGVSFPFRLRTFKGPGIPRPPPLPLQVLCISQSRGTLSDPKHCNAFPFSFCLPPIYPSEYINLCLNSKKPLKKERETHKCAASLCYWVSDHYSAR